MIDNGIDKINELRQKEQSKSKNRERQELFNRLHVILMSAPGQDREATRVWLSELEGMDHEQRPEAIRQRFGDQVLQRCTRQLDQLKYVGL